MLATFRHQNHLFGRLFLGAGGPEFPVESAEPPPPPPPPAAPPPALPPPAPPAPPVCRPIGRSFVQDRICYQLFECRHEDGTITYKKENAECPTPRPGPVIVYPYPYPYGYPGAYPVTQGPSQIVIEDAGAPSKTTLEKAAPYAAAGVIGAALLYAILS